MPTILSKHEETISEYTLNESTQREVEKRVTYTVQKVRVRCVNPNCKGPLYVYYWRYQPKSSRRRVPGKQLRRLCSVCLAELFRPGWEERVRVERLSRVAIGRVQ
jgi:hypothetical protein